MKLQNRPIQNKLMTVILLTSAVVLSVMCAAYMILEYITYRDTVKSHVATLGEVIAANSTAALAFQSEKDAEEILNALRAEKSIRTACLFDNTGKVFAIYPSNHTIPPILIEKTGYWFEDDNLVGYQPVVQGESRLGTLYLQSGLDAMYAQLRQYAMIGLCLIGGSLLLAFLLSKLLQRSISEPILALEQTAKVISEKHDYSVRAAKHGEDEVGALTDAFNQMLSQIQAQNEEITSFNQKLEQKVNERTNDLKQQKEFVETVINSSVDLVSVYDKELNYILINKRGIEFYGMNTQNIIGRNILEVYPQTKTSGMYDDLKTALTGIPVHNMRYKSIALNRYFENYYIPLKDYNDNVYGVMTIGHDITNIIEASEKLEALNAELLKSNRDLEQFAYVASHDLQEPLRKIQTFTQLLAEYIGNNEQAKNYQHKINQSAERMQVLIRDVLDFSRLSNSEDAFVETDLNKVIDNLQSDFELLLREKDATITHSQLPTIKGIPLQLSQLFSNLISNSIKYSEKKPVINISSEKLGEEEIKKYPKLNGNPSYTRITFMDNGIGFEPEYNEQIFAIFQRLHGRQKYHGTGIGLAICRKIVENHHGIIYAEGKPGKGATFNIILPINNYN